MEGMYTKPVITTYGVDPDIFNTLEWREFVKENPTINKDIKEFYISKMGSFNFNNIGCATLDEIVAHLNKPKHLVRQTLAIWSTSYTTFFKLYGRLFYHHDMNTWCYMSESHPKSRMQIPY